MSRRSKVIAGESRPALSPNVWMALKYLAFLVFMVFALYPVCLVLTFAFRGEAETTTQSLVRLRDFNLSALFDSSFSQSCTQTALIALAVGVAGAALTSAVGYLLSRWDARLRGNAINRFLIPQILPPLILLATLAFILLRLGRLHSWLWIGAVYLATAAPFSSWQLKRAYDTISPSVEEAAAIDGCSSWQSFYYIILPALAPALVLTALFSFMIVWNSCLIIGSVLHGGGIFSPLPQRGVPYPTNAVTIWAFYSVAMLLAALLVGLCLLLFGWLTARDRIVDS
jgi:ABC-type maltose transport system permease subunit